MKNLFAAMLVLFSITPIFSQYPLADGQSQINAGIGFSSWGLPLYVGFDHGIHRDISLGAEASFRGYRERFGEFRYRHNIFGFSVNGNYHFNTIFEMPSDEWDLYAGLNIGFFVWSSPNDYNGNNASGLGLGGQIGGRYYFNQNVGVNLEVGGGNAFSGGKIGLTFML